jgi:hypothetical protein
MAVTLGLVSAPAWVWSFSPPGLLLPMPVRQVQLSIERCREVSNIHDELLARSAPAFAASISPTSMFLLFWSLQLVASVRLRKG